VRLKKKNKPAAPPEAKPEQPQPPAEPPKPKPKFDDQAELDPRDDLKPQPAEEPERNEILERLAKNTRLSEEKLANRELGEGVRKLHEEAIEDLDRLIEQAKQDPPPSPDQQNQQNDPNGGGQQQPQGGGADQQPSGAQQRGQQRREARRQQRQGQQQASRGQGGRQQGQDQPQPSLARGGNEPGGGGTSATGKPQDVDKKFDLWGHLPEKERALMNKEMEQKFMDKYDDLTRQYYRTIAEKSRKK
jgi:hypothetical protein